MGDTLATNDVVSKPCPDIALRARVKTLACVRALATRLERADQERADALDRVYEVETRIRVGLEAANILRCEEMLTPGVTPEKTTDLGRRRS